MRDAPVFSILLTLALFLALAGWSVYATACILNHVGVWPASYLGEG
jgi:hypothetical protein